MLGPAAETFHYKMLPTTESKIKVSQMYNLITRCFVTIFEYKESEVDHLVVISV